MQQYNSCTAVVLLIFWFFQNRDVKIGSALCVWKDCPKGCTVFDYMCRHLYLYDVACECKRFPVAIAILHVLIDFNVVLLTANSDGFFLSSHVTQKTQSCKVLLWLSLLGWILCFSLFDTVKDGKDNACLCLVWNVSLLFSSISTMFHFRLF